MTCSPDPFATATVRRAYDTAAQAYADAFGGELAHLPFDRAMLTAAVEALDRDGLVIECGCGPASASAFLEGTGFRRAALDLSYQMVRLAAQRVHGLAVLQGDVRRLPLRNGSASLLVAFYVIQHLARQDLPDVFAGFARVLAPGGRILLATHLGEGHVEIDDFLGHRIDPMGGAFHTIDEVHALLAGAGFDISLERQRRPVPGEFDTQRLYVLATRS